MLLKQDIIFRMSFLSYHSLVFGLHLRSDKIAALIWNICTSHAKVESSKRPLQVIEFRKKVNGYDRDSEVPPMRVRRSFDTRRPGHSVLSTLWSDGELCW